MPQIGQKPIIFDDPTAEALLDTIIATTPDSKLPFTVGKTVSHGGPGAQIQRGINLIIQALEKMGFTYPDEDIVRQQIGEAIFEKLLLDQTT